MHPLVKGTVSHQAHVGVPTGTFEEEHGRDGFYGPVSHLYRTHAPTGWTAIDGPLKPRAYDANGLSTILAEKSLRPNWPAQSLPEAMALLSRIPVLQNDDVVLHLAFPAEPMPFYFRNADGDETLFVHRGQGVIETDFGPLFFRPGDYLVIPRGTTYRLLPETADNFLLVIESFSRIRQPDRGLLGQHALYDPAVIKTPEPTPIDEPGPWQVKIKRLNEITTVTYPFNPMDVVGWKGDLSVWQLNVSDIRPVMSHRAHLAPSVHTTFLAEGFVICTFVPRPLETDPEAQRVPFFHRNIDYDEVLFYHDGEFFSRDGIRPGMITFHPQGIHHGPHPRAMAASWKKTQTHEVAVMVDTNRPLHPTPWASNVERPDYYLSWQ